MITKNNPLAHHIMIVQFYEEKIKNQRVESFYGIVFLADAPNKVPMP